MALQQRIQEQLEEIERRYNELLDEVQDRLPDRAAELMERARDLNADIRRQLTDTGRRLLGHDETDEGDEGEPAPDTSQPTSAEPGPWSDEDDLEELSRAELYERAKALDIEGRSRMSKAQLLDAVRGAGPVP